MIILDLFNTHHEKALKEGAVGADESMGYGGLAGKELDEYIQRRRDTNYSEFPAGTRVTHAMMGDHVGKVVDAKNIPIEDRRDSGVPVQFGNRIYWMSPSGLKMFGNSSMSENSEELVGFHLDTELAYQAVMRKFGNVVSQDPESGTMYVPASVWTQVEQVAFDADGRGAEREEGVAEGLPQTLRKFVPGYAKREIDKKMDAEKFGRTDVDRDANYYRYKKIQDKLKEQGVAEDNLNELSTPKLAQYKTAAAVDAKKSDAAGNYARGDRRFKGINQATIKQFANDAKTHASTVKEQSSAGSDAVEQAILKRIMVSHTDLLMQFGPEKVMQAAEELAYNVGDVDEIGPSDVSAYVRQVRQILGAE